MVPCSTLHYGGKGALYMKALMLSHCFIQDHNHVAKCLPAPVNIADPRLCVRGCCFTQTCVWSRSPPNGSVRNFNDDPILCCSRPVVHALIERRVYDAVVRDKRWCSWAYIKRYVPFMVKHAIRVPFRNHVYVLHAKHKDHSHIAVIEFTSPIHTLKNTHIFQLAHLRISCRIQVIRMYVLHTCDVRCQEGDHTSHERRTCSLGVDWKT